jgi:hypothetical protein
MRIRDPKSFDPGFGMEKFGSRIREKYPGFATLLISYNKYLPGPCQFQAQRNIVQTEVVFFCSALCFPEGKKKLYLILSLFFRIL